MRLIDADALPITTLTDGGEYKVNVAYKRDIDNAPTIDSDLSFGNNFQEDKLTIHLDNFYGFAIKENGIIHIYNCPKQISDFGTIIINGVEFRQVTPIP